MPEEDQETGTFGTPALTSFCTPPSCGTHDMEPSGCLQTPGTSVCCPFTREGQWG